MKFSYKIILFIPLFFLFSCGNVKSGSEEKNEESIEDLEGVFKVTAVNGMEVSSEDITLKINSEENTFWVSAGCNILLSKYQVKKEKILVEPAMRTEMYCEGKMKNEDAIAKVLPEISKLTQTGDKFLFLSATNEALLTVLKKEERE